MNYEAKPPLEVFNANHNPEQEIGRLRGEIAALAAESGVELSADELRIAAEGASEQPEPKKEQGEAYVPFKLLERAARIGLRAQEEAEQKDAAPWRNKLKELGIQHLVLLAATFLHSAPEKAEQCLEHARAIQRGEREWNKADIPPAAPPAWSEAEELPREEAQRRKAA